MKTYKLSPKILSFLDKKFCLDYPPEITDAELKLLLMRVYEMGQKAASFKVEKMSGKLKK